ncbi:DUF4321 domain-containing protein [Paenibacillus athensensis]|uniref:DUF4321 domain-containing protein n=1 Tax=Paenibacillus athensensis TaxID=1967502 RepID=A0A4Y8PVY4_9BACL|nr:DUF4321 domain-containing protein [Paenibacillus athensensis]MCD1258203.1 DUF4321 domain-containing protein [Paenibacillus athensensis]
MKKNTITLVLFLIVGLLAGVIVGQLLEPVPALGFLSKSTQISWEPKGDLQVLKYELHLQIKLNLCTILGLAGAYLLYRKL